MVRIASPALVAVASVLALASVALSTATPAATVAGSGYRGTLTARALLCNSGTALTHPTRGRWTIGSGPDGSASLTLTFASIGRRPLAVHLVGGRRAGDPDHPKWEFGTTSTTKTATATLDGDRFVVRIVGGPCRGDPSSAVVKTYEGVLRQPGD